QERTEIERRRKYVASWRFVQRLTESAIVVRLAKLDPPIVTTRTTVSRDVQALRTTFRQHFSQRNFDPRAEVGIIVAGIEHVIAKSFRGRGGRQTGRNARSIERSRSTRSRNCRRCIRTADSSHERDFLLPLDDGKKVERIPSGIELQ